jgi:acetyltransferase-like isoleucine patch superfamily enzyme
VALIDPSVFLSRTATVGAGCVLYPHCFVGLNARIGNDVVVEDRVVIASLAGSVPIEPDCYLGQACTVRQQVRIGQGSVIGMGAVVIRDVAPGSVIVGNPGRKLRGAP